LTAICVKQFTKQYLGGGLVLYELAKN
jgi:hypothetical protein